MVRALLEAVGPAGTLAAVASWDDVPFRLERWPPAWRAAYLEEMPEVRPGAVGGEQRVRPAARAAANVAGRAQSAHPDQRVVAVGRLADWLTATHPLGDSFGPGTPFARLVEAGGCVLMLGAPLRSLTLLHHAEAIAGVPGSAAGRTRCRSRPPPARLADAPRHRLRSRTVPVRRGGTRRRSPSRACGGRRGERPRGGRRLSPVPAVDLVAVRHTLARGALRQPDDRRARERQRRGPRTTRAGTATPPRSRPA